MKASISFPEIQNLITEKANQPISLSFVDPKTVRVTYPLNLGFIKKDISANLIIKELIGSDLLLQLSTGFSADTMLTTVLSLLQNKIPEGLIEKRPDSHLLLHLGQIEQMKSVFEKIDIHDLHVLNEGLEVEGALK
ncbi:MAG: hypothetical protein J6T22_04925 [Bacteroidales bacterium]|jgi:hypothetical protein|nr:hypothetical protein [Bacteroidales bacterium]